MKYSKEFFKEKTHRKKIVPMCFCYTKFHVKPENRRIKSSHMERRWIFTATNEEPMPRYRRDKYGQAIMIKQSAVASPKKKTENLAESSHALKESTKSSGDIVNHHFIHGKLFRFQLPITLVIISKITQSPQWLCYDTMANRTIHYGQQNSPQWPTEQSTMANRTVHNGQQNSPLWPTEQSTMANRTVHYGQQSSSATDLFLCAIHGIIPCSNCTVLKVFHDFSVISSSRKTIASGARVFVAQSACKHSLYTVFATGTVWQWNCVTMEFIF